MENTELPEPVRRLDLMKILNGLFKLTSEYKQMDILEGMTTETLYSLIEKHLEYLTDEKMKQMVYLCYDIDNPKSTKEIAQDIVSSEAYVSKLRKQYLNKLFFWIKKR